MPFEDKVEYFGRLYELTFKTSKGSLYYFDRENGLWLRKKFDGTDESKCINVGCLIEYGSIVHAWQILSQVQKGEIREFVPEFKVGREVLGIYIDKRDRAISREDFVLLERGKIKVRGTLNPHLGIHIGHAIDEIYREVDPMREYNHN